MLVTLTGGSGAGKTTLAAALAATAPRVPTQVLHGDDYYFRTVGQGVWAPDETGVPRLDVGDPRSQDLKRLSHDSDTALAHVPVVIVVQNNHFAYSTPTERQMLNTNICERIEGGWSISCARVDGTDVLAVYETVRAAVERARAGAGPQAVEALTLRGHGHAAHDDARYVPEELRQEYSERWDPVSRLEERLLLDGVATTLLAERLAAAGTRVVTVAFGSPYVLRGLPRARTEVLGYGSQRGAQVAVARALFGEASVGGRLPVTIPGVAERGAGIERPVRP